jgi:hypothetical protein
VYLYSARFADFHLQIELDAEPCFGKYSAAMRRSVASSLGRAAILAAMCGAASIPAFAQQVTQPTHGVAEARDHEIVLELGAAGEWSSSEGGQPGITCAFEVTPIEHWLELESGVTAARANGSTETSVDLLFKKPWPISPRFEFMAGIGPELIHATGTQHGSFWGLEIVSDFMVWPRPNVGWYVEPGYEVTFRNGAARSGLALAAGLIVGW